MMSWHSLFFRSDPGNTEQSVVVAALMEALSRHGYQRYDPFPGGLGTPPEFKTFVKHFVAPPDTGWVRVLGTPDLAALGELSVGHTVLHILLTNTEGRIEIYRGGKLEEVKQAKNTSPQSKDPLPGELEQFARDHNVNIKQANKMMNRLTGQLFGKMDRSSNGEASAMQDQAQALLSGGGQPDWESSAARQLQREAQAFGLSPNWWKPDFGTVREAYQVARRLRRHPNARLMADEQAALNALPSVDVYEAVYMGK